MIGVRSKHHVSELDRAGVALVGVDAVVPDEEDGQVLHVDSSAEELHSVVKVERDLNMIHLRARPHSAEGDTVDLVVLANHRSAVPDANTLDGIGSGASRPDRSVSEDDETSPEAAGGQILRGHRGGERDGIGSITRGDDLRTAFYNQRRGPSSSVVRIGEDRRPLLDRQNRSVGNEDLAGEQNRGVVRPGRVCGDITAGENSFDVIRRPRVVIQPGQPREPVFASTEGTRIRHLVEEAVGRRHRRRRQERARRRWPWIGEDSGWIRRLRLQDQKGIGVGRLERGFSGAVVPKELRSPRIYRVDEGIEVRRPISVERTSQGGGERLVGAVAIQDSCRANVGDQDVSEAAARSFAEPDDGGLRVVTGHGVRVVVDVANEVGIVKLGIRATGSAAHKPVHLCTVVRRASEHDVRVLDASPVALIRVDAVVATVEDRHVLGVHGTSEELHAVVKVERDFDMIHLRARSDTAE
eukprot:scaffold8320_cov506-Pinguiococcus_pyrenoidosus.AAC.1